MRRFVILLGILLLPGTTVEAQAERQTGFMVHQWGVCQDMAAVNRLSDIMTPILEALVEEGMIRAWYDIWS